MKGTWAVQQSSVFSPSLAVFICKIYILSSWFLAYKINLRNLPQTRGFKALCFSAPRAWKSLLLFLLQAQSNCSNTWKQQLRVAGEQPDTARVTVSRSEVCHCCPVFELLPNTDFLRSFPYTCIIVIVHIYYRYHIHACLLQLHAHSNTSHQHAQIIQPCTNPEGMYCCQTVKSLFPFSFHFQFCLPLPKDLTFQGREQLGFTHLNRIWAGRANLVHTNMHKELQI